MTDNFGRNIDYLRISVTDRCNLRCRYCMPNGVSDVSHDDILRYEEILRLCQIAVSIGINRFKITGGEPLVRAGVTEFISNLKRMDGVKCVTLTTNGILLEEHLEQLKNAGIDGINISLDTLNKEKYKNITGKDCMETVLSAMKKSVELGIHTKINAVLLNENDEEYILLAELAKAMTVDVRFIELMPIGFGTSMEGKSIDDLLNVFKRRWSDFHRVYEKRGNGPAYYYASKDFKGRVGFIAANTHIFCDKCNRLRLTSTGKLKPCLCYDTNVDFRQILRAGAEDEYIKSKLIEIVHNKPAAHCFADRNSITEIKRMNEIGG